jgi:hypothetical protein
MHAQKPITVEDFHFLTTFKGRLEPTHFLVSYWTFVVHQKKEKRKKKKNQRWDPKTYDASLTLFEAFGRPI